MYGPLRYQFDSKVTAASLLVPKVPGAVKLTDRDFPYSVKLPLSTTRNACGAISNEGPGAPQVGDVGIEMTLVRLATFRVGPSRTVVKLLTLHSAIDFSFLVNRQPDIE